MEQAARVLVRRRPCRMRHETSRHAQMHHEAAWFFLLAFPLPGQHAKKDEFSAPVHGADAAAAQRVQRQALRQDDGRTQQLHPHDTGIEHLGAQRTNDGFHFGQFRHGNILFADPSTQPVSEESP